MFYFFYDRSYYIEYPTKNWKSPIIIEQHNFPISKRIVFYGIPMTNDWLNYDQSFCVSRWHITYKKINYVRIILNWLKHVKRTTA